MDKAIEIKNFTKKYDQVNALDDISLNIDLGKISGVLGPNGSGKTTLLKALAGLIRQDMGDIILDGQKISNIDKNKIAYLPDEKFLYANQSIKESSHMYGDFYDGFDRDFFDKILEYFYLNPKSNIKSLSKGDYKKLGLCLNLSRNADIYIFDEPLDGIDPISAAKIIDLIIEKAEDEKTFLISTHQIAQMENLFDQVIFLAEGRIHDFGSAREIRNQNQMDISDYYDEIYLG